MCECKRSGSIYRAAADILLHSSWSSARQIYGGKPNFPPSRSRSFEQTFFVWGTYSRVNNYIEGKSTEIILCWSFSRVLRKIQYTLAISPGFLTEFETKINKKNLFILVFFKGIVSQDFRGLLVILIDRAYGPGIPLDVYLSFMFSYSILSLKFLSGLSF